MSFFNAKNFSEPQVLLTIDFWPNFLPRLLLTSSIPNRVSDLNTDDFCARKTTFYMKMRDRNVTTKNKNVNISSLKKLVIFVELMKIERQYSKNDLKIFFNVKLELWKGALSGNIPQ